MLRNPRVNAVPRLPWIRILASVIVASSLLLSFAVQEAKAAAATAKAFHDPVYGFTFSYPLSWTAITERNGSNVTLVNPATNSLISPVVQATGVAPAAALTAAVPTNAVNVRTGTVSDRTQSNTQFLMIQAQLQLRQEPRGLERNLRMLCLRHRTAPAARISTSSC